MSYIILYFSIGLALAIATYLYSCYDYRVNYKDWSWHGYVKLNDTYKIIGGVILAYPIFLCVLMYIGIRWCVSYTTTAIREYIFKIIDQYFV